MQLESCSFRRTLVLKGCGVFFCTPQAVHSLFRVGKVFVLQHPLFRFGQALCPQGRFVLRVLGQHFLCAAHDVAQQFLHLVHHFADGACPARILLSLLPLELHPALEARFIAEDAAPGVRHQFFRRLFIGQALLCIVREFLPDHRVDVLIALALCQKFQRVLLQCLCAFGVQRVVPVVVLVQNGAEHVLGAVRKIDLCHLGVYIGFHPVIALQHRLQHCVGVRSPGVQLDQLGAHIVCRAHGPLIKHPSAAAGALFGQFSAQGPPLHAPGFHLAVPLQPRQL